MDFRFEKSAEKSFPGKQHEPKWKKMEDDMIVFVLSLSLSRISNINTNYHTENLEDSN